MVWCLYFSSSGWRAMLAAPHWNQTRANRVSPDFASPLLRQRRLRNKVIDFSDICTYIFCDQILSRFMKNRSNVYIRLGQKLISTLVFIWVFALLLSDWNQNQMFKGQKNEKRNKSSTKFSLLNEPEHQKPPVNDIATQLNTIANTEQRLKQPWPGSGKVTLWLLFALFSLKLNSYKFTLISATPVARLDLTKITGLFFFFKFMLKSKNLFFF